MIIKRKFAERWARQFSKQYNGIISMLSDVFVRKETLEDGVMETYDYIFTIAKLAKVKPKAFAKLILDKEALIEYVSQIHEARMDIEEELANPKPAKKKKAKTKVTKKKGKK